MNIAVIALACGILIVALLVIVWPLQLAAKMIEAKHTSFGRCFLSLIVANVLAGIVFVALPGLVVVAGLVDLIVMAIIFAGILGTTFFKGLAIAVVYLVILIALTILIVIIAGVLGISTAALGV